jgi:phosphotransferase system HPr (HPr) family protein
VNRTSIAIELEVQHPAGLHLRPAALFVQTAATFQAAIRVRNITRGTTFKNAKSTLEVMMLGVACGHTIALEADGDDAESAVQAIVALVQNNFGESASD